MKSIFILLSLISSQAFAGAWLMDKNHGEVILQYRNQSRTLDDLSELSIYAQYGVLEKTTAGIIADYRPSDALSVDGQSNSQGLFFRQLFLKKAHSVTSLQGTIGVTTGTWYEARLNHGFSWEKTFSYFVDLQLAAKAYADVSDEETKFDATFGMKFSKTREIYLQNFNTWTKSFHSHELQGIYSQSLTENSQHSFFGGASIPWGSKGIATSVILVGGYRLDF